MTLRCDKRSHWAVITMWTATERFSCREQRKMGEAGDDGELDCCRGLGSRPRTWRVGIARARCRFARVMHFSTSYASQSWDNILLSLRETYLTTAIKMPHATQPSPGFQAFILCGPGASLSTFTSEAQTFPKALVPIANRPMVWYPLEWCYRMGVTSTSAYVAIMLLSPVQANPTLLQTSRL